VTAERLDDLIAADRAVASCEQGVCRHDHARGAIPALGGVAVVEGRLNRGGALGGPDPLDRCDLGIADHADRQQAGPARLAVDQHGAGATATLLAPGLGAGEVEILAQDRQQRRRR